MFNLEALRLGPDGRVWYRALLPMRPNGTTGYVPADALRVVQTDDRLVVSQRALTLRLYRGCRLIRTFPIGLARTGPPLRAAASTRCR